MAESGGRGQGRGAASGRGQGVTPIDLNNVRARTGAESGGRIRAGAGGRIRAGAQRQEEGRRKGQGQGRSIFAGADLTNPHHPTDQRGAGYSLSS